MSPAEEQQSILEQIDRFYSIGPVVSLCKTTHGGAWLAQAASGRFAVKMRQRADHLNVLLKAQPALELQGFRCNQLVPTAEKACMTPQGLALLTWLDGDSFTTLNAAQTQAAMVYMKGYLSALATVPVTNSDFQRLNVWDDAQSLHYLLSDFPGLLMSTDLPKPFKDVILHAVTRLRSQGQRLRAEKRQLIHADLGPDNFLFRDDQVVAAIDFTPAFDSPLYAVAQFIYWNDLYPSPATPVSRLLECFRTLQLPIADDALAYTMLLRAALFRVVGPLLELMQAGSGDWEQLRPRVACLQALLQAQI